MDKPLQVCILNGTMRPRGHTAELVKPLMQALMLGEAHVMYIALHDKSIAPCAGCGHCQRAPSEPGCAIRDDMDSLYSVILNADVLVFATPIYTWYCTSPMKSMIDRLYALSKYEAGQQALSMLEGKSLALVCTCGDPPEEACAPFEQGMRNYARHVKMDFLGMLTQRDLRGIADFQTDEAVQRAQDFAQVILARGGG